MIPTAAQITAACADLVRADPHVWPPIAPARARAAIAAERKRASFWPANLSDFLTIEESLAVRNWFMREGKGSDTFNSTVRRIAKVRG